MGRVGVKLSPQIVLGIRFSTVLLLTVVAYRYSLLTLLRGLTLDTPLADLALVPVIVLILILVRALLPHDEPDIHDRYLDYMIGLPLLAAALVMVLVLPIRLSSFYWLWRIDLLSLPLFVAGAVCTVFGLRALWRIRVAIAFLFLAWPLPYVMVLNGELDRVTAITLGALRLVLHVVPLAQSVPSPDQSLFSVSHGSNRFAISVGSACSGVNGMVGFGLVGLAFASLVRGRLSAKLLWLGAGLALIWSLDIARILLIFAAGDRWGETFALQILHPIVGLAFFNVGVVAMILLLPVFHLRVWIPRRRATTSRMAEGRKASLRKPAVKHAGVAIAILAVLAGFVAVADADMQHYELLAQDFGPPRLVALSVATATVPGWSQTETASYPWVTRYFGDGATWDRFEFARPAEDATTFSPFAPVTLDVISTGNLHTFSAFGLEACYRFHDYRILATQRVDLGAGIIGHTIVSMTASGSSIATWNAVYWEWPVITSTGLRYERVVLNVTQADRGSQAIGFLTGFARQIVASTAAESAPVGASA